MPAPATRSVVSVSDLLDHAGASRAIAVELSAPEDGDRSLVQRIAPVRLEGVLESLVDGILVRGTLRTRVHMTCARCLEPLAVDVEADVAELYAEPGQDSEVEEGYEIRDGVIDLDHLVRDALLPRIPVAPRCREDCRGLCPSCGSNLNEGDCDCEPDDRDLRWSALEGLRLNDN
jgi:uncharacterized protein